MKKSNALRKPKLVPALLKIDLGAGQSPRAGFTGVDIMPGSEIEHDLFQFPWPFDPESVDEVHCSHFFEHVPGRLRGKFMDELWRIMKIGAQATFITPYWNSMRASQDFTHEWPPVSEATYLYFNKGWRVQNKLDHYPVSCDFDFSYGYLLDPETAVRPADSQAFWVKHYTGAVMDMQVVLTRRK